MQREKANDGATEEYEKLLNRMLTKFRWCSLLSFWDFVGKCLRGRRRKIFAVIVEEKSRGLSKLPLDGKVRRKLGGKCGKGKEGI
jgi:hypothetical protein